VTRRPGGSLRLTSWNASRLGNADHLPLIALTTIGRVPSVSAAIECCSIWSGCAEVGTSRRAVVFGGVVYLTATEEDRLRIFTAAELARRARADGLALSVPEATAIVCDEMHRAARAGADANGVLAAGRAAVQADELMDGVSALLDEIRLEVLLDDGTRLIVLREPWVVT
jgi:urease gamma subunit